MIVVATPTRGEVLATFTQDLIQLLSKTPDTLWIPCIGTLISNNRTLLVHEAVKRQASHILFIDSDMRFPADALDKLLEHKKDIVGANYKQRTRDEWAAHKDDKFVTGKGLQEVDTLGFGFVLINMNVFTSKLRPLPPNAFSTPFDAQEGIFVGEDVYFCTIAKEHGYKVWIDHDIKLKHTGSREL